MVESGEKWGIKMLIGEYHHNLDNKGRLTLPSKFRDELGEDIVITRGFENTLLVYTSKVFEKYIYPSFYKTRF